MNDLQYLIMINLKKLVVNKLILQKTCGKKQSDEIDFQNDCGFDEIDEEELNEILGN